MVVSNIYTAISRECLILEYTSVRYGCVRDVSIIMNVSTKTETLSSRHCLWVVYN